MELIHVQVVEAEPPQARIATFPNIFGGDVAPAGDFAGDYDLPSTFAPVKLSTPHPLADDKFRISLGCLPAIAGDGILFRLREASNNNNNNNSKALDDDFDFNDDDVEQH
jgi:hypothetical protein